MQSEKKKNWTVHILREHNKETGAWAETIAKSGKKKWADDGEVVWSDVTRMEASLVVELACVFRCSSMPFAGIQSIRIVIPRVTRSTPRSVASPGMRVDKLMSKCVCPPMHDVLSEKSNSTPRIALVVS